MADCSGVFTAQAIMAMKSFKNSTTRSELREKRRAVGDPDRSHQGQSVQQLVGSVLSWDST